MIKLLQAILTLIHTPATFCMTPLKILKTIIFVCRPKKYIPDMSPGLGSTDLQIIQGSSVSPLYTPHNTPGFSAAAHGQKVHGDPVKGGVFERVGEVYGHMGKCASLVLLPTPPPPPHSGVITYMQVTCAT